MIGKTLIKNIVTKDYYDSKIFVKIPTEKIKELVDKEIKSSEMFNHPPEDLILPIDRIGYDSDFKDEIILCLDADYDDGMPF